MERLPLHTTRYGIRFDNNNIQYKLQEVLNSNDLIPPLSDIAQQLEVPREQIRRRFPDLHKSIAIRRSDEQERIRKNVLIESSQKIREAIMMFHQEGIYPSTNRITTYLGESFIFMKKSNRDVREATMKDLGYFNDN